VTPAHWISDGSPIAFEPLKAPQPRRTWHFRRYEIALAPRRGRWSIGFQGEMTPDEQGRLTLTGRAYGVAGYRTLIGAVLATWRAGRREP
jgi:hypothetical protein